MRVEILNTGSELTMGFVTNTHLAYLARKLNDLGLEVSRQTTVGDSAEELRESFGEALARSELLIVTGGLGPTSDDITRDVVAAVLGRRLHMDNAVLESIRNRFIRSSRPMPKQMERQALIPDGATVLPNPNGSAPGLAFEISERIGSSVKKLVVLLPGPPRELIPMFENHAVELIRKFVGEQSPLEVRVLKIACLGESLIAERIGDIVADMPGVEIGYCARPAEVDVRVVAHPAGKAASVQTLSAIADDAAWRIRGVLGTSIFASGDEKMEEVIFRLLRERKQTLATAESCTGGFLSHRLTNVSGSSEVFVNGLVTYSNESKVRLLGVSQSTLDKFGAVSEETVREMAQGVRARSYTDYGIGITGIAGPTGGTPEKPVGTVFIALASANGTHATQHRFQFDRETFKFVASQYAMEKLRRRILGLPDHAQLYRY